MTDKLISAISAAYPLRELDAGAYGTLKVNGMNFRIRAFRAEGLGHVSLMTASGFLGLMKMDTLIINPTARNMPLLSYDRIHAMGNDTLIYELFDTTTGPVSLTETRKAQETGASLPDHDLGTHWYAHIKLPQSLSKKGKKKHTPAFDRLTEEYMAAYLSDCADTDICGEEEKREKASFYVEGLLTHGGPCTDIFTKALGKEKVEYLFRHLLFGTKA